MRLDVVRLREPLTIPWPLLTIYCGEEQDQLATVCGALLPESPLGRDVDMWDIPEWGIRSHALRSDPHFSA